MNHKEHKDHKEDKEDKEDKGAKASTFFTAATMNGIGATGSKTPPIAASTERVVREVIGAAIQVHRALGPGFIEPVYERAMRVELDCRNLRVARQKSILIQYRGKPLCRHQLDFVIEDVVIVEVKAVKWLRPIHQAQILSYLKASGCRIGLLMNFNVPLLIDGLRRFVR
jgi:GxxExxY protein